MIITPFPLYTVPEWHCVTDVPEARRHNRLGYIKLNDGALEGALKEFTEAVTLDPGNSSFRYARISVLEKLSRNQETVPEYDLLIEKDPRNLEYYLGKIRVLEKLEHLNQVIDTYEKAIETHSHNPDLHFEMSKFFGKYESYDRAVGEIEKAIDLNPEEPRYLHTLAELYQIVEEDKIALMVYDRLLGVNDREPQFHYEKARILERLGRIGDAELEMEKIMEMRPHSLDWALMFAEFLETHRKFEKALGIRSHILELDPDTWEHYEERAALSSELGQENESEEDLRTAKKLEQAFNSRYRKTGAERPKDQ